jgi:hypothetical protein
MWGRAIPLFSLCYDMYAIADYSKPTMASTHCFTISRAY